MLRGASLSHLELYRAYYHFIRPHQSLTVAKRLTYVEKFALELREPYYPVLWVKMHELLVEMNFAPPDADRPSLPINSSSHFTGRIFLVPVEENLRCSYSDFARVP